LDFSGHVLTRQAIESVKNIPQIVIIAYGRRIVANKAIILKFLSN
jgi:hypothetical protein